MLVRLATTIGGVTAAFTAAGAEIATGATLPVADAMIEVTAP